MVSAHDSDGKLTNIRVVFSARSHLSGASVWVDPGSFGEGVIILELYELDCEDVLPLRSSSIDIAMLEAGEPEHLYWDPVEDSKDRFFSLRARIPRGQA